MGTLHYGDNLTIMRNDIPPESVDLIYLDPPFKSDANYNVLFKSPTGEPAQAQAEAFVDTWNWGQESAHSYDEVMEQGGRAALTLRSMKAFLGENAMMAYLANMSVRLIEMHKVLSPTGSLYLHCDPAASHYLKIILDGIFSPKNFRSEVIWKRTSSHNSAKKWGPIHDVVFFYSKSDVFSWNKVYMDYDPKYVENYYRHKDKDGHRFRLSDLTGSGKRDGESGSLWRRYNPTERGRHWAVPSRATKEYGLENLKTIDALEALDRVGRIHWSENNTPSFVRYLDEMPGQLLQDIIHDIQPLSSQNAERLGYPTQKPLALLERIIEASTDRNDVILDPFCGCGTTVHAAESLGRKWIGIDVTHYAVSLIETRIKEHFPNAPLAVKGRPEDLATARDLAKRNLAQFHWWAAWLCRCHAFREGKQKQDGVDGLYFFRNGPMGEGVVIVSVTARGKPTESKVKELYATVDQQDADLGVLVSLNNPSQKVTAAAASLGIVNTAHGKFPKVQVVTVEDLLHGNKLDLPRPFVIHSRQEMRRGRDKWKRMGEDARQLNFTFSIAGGGKKKQADLMDWRSPSKIVIGGE